MLGHTVAAHRDTGDEGGEPLLTHLNRLVSLLTDPVHEHQFRHDASAVESGGSVARPCDEEKPSLDHGQRFVR